MKQPAHRRNHRCARLLLVGLIPAALAAAACSKSDPPPDDPVPHVELALATVPSNVACVAITIATDRTDRRRFDVVPGRPASFRLTGLQVGVTVFSVDAFPKGCGEPSSGATWTGGPVTVTLKPGRNPTIFIELLPTSEVTVSIGFGPGTVPTCAAGGSACSAHGDCCSQWCSLPTNLRSGIGTCRADEPPSPTRTDLVYQPELLAPLNGRASYPGFDGDFFLVTFPREGEDYHHPERSAEQVRDRYLLPALLATGLTQGRLTTMQTPPSASLELAGGDYRSLVEDVCLGRGDNDPAAARSCGALLNPDGFGTPQGSPRSNPLALIESTVGMTPRVLRQEIQRKVHYWTFSQRERGVPIEHKGAVVLKHEGQRVSAVFGAVLNRTLITNEIALNAEAAIRRALPILERIEGAKLAPAKDPARQATLVLLPYGATAPAVGGPAPTGGATALRFAYRVGLAGTQPTGNGDAEMAYAVWVDAATGDVLKYVAETAAAAVPFVPFCRDPSETGRQCSKNLEIAPLVPVPPLTYTLASQSAFRVSPAGATSVYPLEDPTELFPPRPTGGAVCALVPDNPPAFRPANAFAHLSSFHKTLTSAGTLTGLNGIEVVIDAPGTQNMATFPPKLSFISGTLVTPPAVDECTAKPAELLPGALDATILAHEYAHLVTMHLQSSNPPNACGSPNCSTADPYNRQFFHDYSDGFAALLTNSPCVGGWAAKNTSEHYASAADHGNPVRDDVARACADGSEGSGLPRLLFADDRPEETFAAKTAFLNGVPPTGSVLKDAFPSRRIVDGGSTGPYGNGQIVGAALWHTWQGLKSQNSSAAILPLWGHLTKAIWATGFTNTVNPVSDENSDLNVYRSGRELLVQLSNAWAATNATQSMNKLLSAFARTGIFLTPPACLYSNPRTTLAQLDPGFCPTERTSADAIIDIDDGDLSEAVETLGIRLAENDYIRVGGNPASLVPPRFRVWTGAPFSFNDLGRTPQGTEPNPLLCNDAYVISVRLRPLGTSQPTWVPLASGSTTSCYAEVPLGPTELQVLEAMMVDKTFTAFEYRVETSRQSDGAFPRSSDRPGNGLWSNTPTAIRPSVFYLTDTGTP